MPEVFRFLGYKFSFYANDHEPVHIHVIGKDGSAKFVWSEEEKKFLLTENFKIKGGDIRKIRQIIDDNADLIQDTWIQFFYNGGNNETDK